MTEPTREWQIPELPEASLFTHEMLDVKMSPNGVHLGVQKKGICEQAHVDGETCEEIHEWFTADQMREYGRQCAATKAPPMPEEVQVAVSHLRSLNAAGLLDGGSVTLLNWLSAQGLVNAKE